MSTDNSWYLLKLRADKALSQEQLLHQLGLESVHPVEIVYRHKSRYARARGEEKQETTRSLLKGYLWLRAPIPERLWQVLWTLNLIDRVDCDPLTGWPRAWADEDVQRVRSAYQLSAYTAPDEERFMQTYLEFCKGDAVTFDHPAMAGFEGKVVDIMGEHSRVLTTLLGAEREVTVPTRSLRRG